jgi:hypothetical protein
MSFRTQPKSEQTLAIERAMELLLSKQQIAYIKSRTFIGRSKREILRSLLNRGIAQEKLEQEWEEDRLREDRLRHAMSSEGV